MTIFYQKDPYDGFFGVYLVNAICAEYYESDISYWMVPGTFSLEG